MYENETRLSNYLQILRQKSQVLERRRLQLRRRCQIQIWTPVNITLRGDKTTLHKTTHDLQKTTRTSVEFVS